MPNALISGGKLVKSGHKIILNNPIATVINKVTNEVVIKAEFDPRLRTWNVYLNGPVPYKFSKEQQVQPLGLSVQRVIHQGIIIHLANNAYRLQTKKEIVEFYHAVAGWLVKRTWIAAIQRNAYTS